MNSRCGILDLGAAFGLEFDISESGFGIWDWDLGLGFGIGIWE
jgi:hypothetical protein